jgi:hypothetical protein
MTSQPTPKSTDKLKGMKGTSKTGKRLLLISDAPERLKRLEFALGFDDAEMVKVASAEEMAGNCYRDHDLAIIDVAPEHIVTILKTLRENEGQIKIPLLVESSRLANDPALAGVLPAHRAMPCSFEDVMKLARRRQPSTSSRRHSRSHKVGRIL